MGQMAEWSNAVVLKTTVGEQSTGGSNPSLPVKRRYQSGNWDRL
jgi:hypothetical protein